MCWMPLTTFTMGDLIDKINEWNFLRNGEIHNSLMQAAGRPYVHPSIFGPKILDWGFRSAVDKIETFHNPVIESNKNYYKGIITSIEQSEPNKELQQQLHVYLTELDNRRGTDYRKLFPIIYDEIHSV